MTEYKATLRAWADVYGMSGPGSPLNQCILELRARVEALEAAQPEQITQEELAKLLAQPARVVPLATASAGSLVERVSCAIDGRINPDQWLHQDAARAAIREVAAWLRSETNYCEDAADLLERQARR